jgi:large subunit ribosomal protein L5
VREKRSESAESAVRALAKEKKKPGKDAQSEGKPVKLPSAFERYFKDECIPGLIKGQGYKSIQEVPRVQKVVVSCCMKEATQDQKVLEKAVEELTLITGQKAVVTKAKKSIANFKLRKGMSIGCCVTLRKHLMYEFLNRLFNIVLPRFRDFRGVSPKGFDGRGNYTLGVREQIVFPEINYDKIDRIRGMNITIVTSAKTDDEGRSLLKQMGMPFREN